MDVTPFTPGWIEFGIALIPYLRFSHHFSSSRDRHKFCRSNLNSDSLTGFLAKSRSCAFNKPSTPAPGCEIEPVELNNALDDGGVIPQLDPGQRTFFSFAFRLTGTSTTTCPQTARFGQQWLDANGKRVGNALVTSSFTLEPRGPELWYVDLLDEIEYR